MSKWTHQTHSGWSTWRIRWKPTQKYFQNIARELPCWLSTTSYMPGWSFWRSAGTGWRASSLWREYSRRSKSDGSTLPFLYKLSWGLEVKVKALFPQHTLLLRTWSLLLLSSSLFSTGLCCILILSSMVCWRFGFSPTELMKWPKLTRLFRHHWTSSWTSLRMPSIRWYINLIFKKLKPQISYLVDFLISGRPRRIHHFYFGIIFGLWYGSSFFRQWSSN